MGFGQAPRPAPFWKFSHVFPFFSDRIPKPSLHGKIMHPGCHLQWRKKPAALERSEGWTASNRKNFTESCRGWKTSLCDRRHWWWTDCQWNLALGPFHRVLAADWKSSCAKISTCSCCDPIFHNRVRMFINVFEMISQIKMWYFKDLWWFYYLNKNFYQVLARSRES